MSLGRDLRNLVGRLLGELTVAAWVVCFIGAMVIIAVTR